MTKLLQKNVKFQWNEKCKQNFQELKQRLVSAPVLTLPGNGKEFTIYNNTSVQGLDYVLMQEDKGSG